MTLAASDQSQPGINILLEQATQECQVFRLKGDGLVWSGQTACKLGQPAPVYTSRVVLTREPRLEANRDRELCACACLQSAKQHASRLHAVWMHEYSNMNGCMSFFIRLL